jgi:cell division protein FtsA
MDTRIGYPNEHLAGNSDEEISCPLYATVVGLVMNSIENKTTSASKIDKNTGTKAERRAIAQVEEEEIIKEDLKDLTIPVIDKKTTEVSSNKKNFFDLSGYLGRIKEFLDNAE